MQNFHIWFVLVDLLRSYLAGKLQNKKPKHNKSRDQLVESDALVKQRRTNQAHSLKFFYIKQRRVQEGGLRRRGSARPALMHEETQKWWDYAKF